MMNAIQNFRQRLFQGLRDIDKEYNELSLEADDFADTIEATKIKFHNMSKRMTKLEAQAGFQNKNVQNKTESIEKTFPLRQRSIENRDLSYYEQTDYLSKMGKSHYTYKNE